MKNRVFPTSLTSGQKRDDLDAEPVRVKPTPEEKIRAKEDNDRAVASWVVMAREDPDQVWASIVEVATREEAAAEAELPFNPEDLARHEAGHAVAAISMGSVVYMVSVEEGKGQSEHRLPRPRPEDQDRAWTELVVAMAGQVANNQARVSDCRSCQRFDSSAMYWAAQIILGGVPPFMYYMPLTFDALMAAARELATYMLGTHGKAVDGITKRLLAEGTISGPEAPSPRGRPKVLPDGS